MDPPTPTLHEEIKEDVPLPDRLAEETNPSGVKRMTVPSLTAVAILQKISDKENIYSLPVHEIYRRLYSGFLLYDEEKKRAEQKFWVEKKFNKNCVLVLSRTMEIAWSEDARYWEYKYEKEKCFDGERDIPVAVLKSVCWLDIRGTLNTMVLSPKTTYDAVFIVKKIGSSRRNAWPNPLSITLCLPDGRMQERLESLMDKPWEDWFDVPIGSFVTSPKTVGELSFQLKETDGWKSGLVIKGVLLQPVDKINK